MAMPVFCLLAACGNDDDHVAMVNLTASDLTEDGYFDGTLYYKITSSTAKTVAVNKAETDVVSAKIPMIVNINGTAYKCTKISDAAFWFCQNLTAVTLPNSIDTIGWDAFYGCSSLTEITIPSSVTVIDDYAFGDCEGLTRVNISSLEAWCRIEFFLSTSNPLSYAHHLYLNGKEIKNLVIPNGITSVGKATFAGGSGFTSITIPNSVVGIHSSAFEGCSNIIGIDIPRNVTYIDDSAFKDCSRLRKVTIPDQVTFVGGSAFFNCFQLSEVTIGSSVNEIRTFAFTLCENLTTIHCKAPVPPTSASLLRVFFDKERLADMTLCVPKGTLDAYRASDIWGVFENIVEE